MRLRCPNCKVEVTMKNLPRAMLALRREGALLRQVAVASRSCLWLRCPDADVFLVSLRWHFSPLSQVAGLCLDSLVRVVLRVVSPRSAATCAGTSRWPDTARLIEKNESIGLLSSVVVAKSPSHQQSWLRRSVGHSETRTFHLSPLSASQPRRPRSQKINVAQTAATVSSAIPFPARPKMM